jgi:hypothetical protein
VIAAVDVASGTALSESAWQDITQSDQTTAAIAGANNGLIAGTHFASLGVRLGLTAIAGLVRAGHGDHGQCEENLNDGSLHGGEWMDGWIDWEWLGEMRKY